MAHLVSREHAVRVISFLIIFVIFFESVIRLKKICIYQIPKFNRRFESIKSLYTRV
jgi:hypothetical protein